MSDNGRIHRKFWDHPKAKAAGNAACGLWARINSWCRDNRTAGYIPSTTALELGTQDEIDALVRERLLLQTNHGYRMKDYEEWNDDIEPDTVAGDLVRETVPEQHPSAIRKQLARKAAELLTEGIDREVVKRALVLWTTKALSPSLLPSLASEAMKESQRSQSLRSVMRECWKSGQVTPLKPFGYVFTPPDFPDNCTDPEDRRAFMLAAKRKWLTELAERVK